MGRGDRRPMAAVGLRASARSAAARRLTFFSANPLWRERRTTTSARTQKAYNLPGGSRTSRQEAVVSYSMGDRSLHLVMEAAADGAASRRTGFTMIELIVVVAIVGIAAAIAIPTVLGVRERNIRVACAASLRNVGLGTSAYALDTRGTLPTHYARGDVVFDTFAMRHKKNDEYGLYVNLGLLTGYVENPASFYCPSHDADHTPSLAHDAPGNRWHGPPPWAHGHGPPIPATPGPPERMNSSFAARCRYQAGRPAPRWMLINHANKVIYTDFIGVDGWRGSGPFSETVLAPHAGKGYNRLYGEGSVSWVDTADVEADRPIDAEAPTAAELRDYFQRLDVLP